MPDTLYYPELWESRPMPHGDSVFQLYRSTQYRELQDEVPFDLDPNRLDDVFCLREIVNGESVFSKDFLLNEFVEGIQDTFPESTTLGTKNIEYGRVTRDHITVDTSIMDQHQILPAVLAADGSVCVCCPQPEAQLIAIATADGSGFSKGDELWRKDARHRRYFDTVALHEILDVDPSGLVVVAFRHWLYEDGEEQVLAWDDEWGEDDSYSVVSVRRPVQGPYGSAPAGIAWLDPITGEAVATHYYPAQELDAPRYTLGYLYDEITWSPGDDPEVPVAEVPRPYGSVVVGYEDLGSGYEYIWNDEGAGHVKWSQCSFRFLADGGITEWSSVGSGSDYINPFGFANGTNGSRKEIDPPYLTYYAAATQTVQRRWIGVTEELAPTRLTGGDPPHSLTKCCSTEDGLLIFGPRDRGRYAFRSLPGGGSEEVEVYDPKRFVWAAYRRTGSTVEQVWQRSLGGVPDEDEDTLRIRMSTVPICAGGQIVTVIADYWATVDVQEYGPVRLVRLDAATGEVVSDTALDKALWGGSDEALSYIDPTAEIHGGRLHVKINGKKIVI